MNEKKAKNMGEAGYKRAKKLFDTDINDKRIFEVYEEILEDFQ